MISINYLITLKKVLAPINHQKISWDFGKKIRKFCKQLIEDDSVYFIIPDTHNIEVRAYEKN